MRVGSRVEFSFPTVPGKSYRVEYKNSLNDPAWIQLGPVLVASEATSTVTDDLEASPQRFYRIAELIKFLQSL